MLQTLQREGYDIKERELSRLRKKKGLQLRAANTGNASVVPAKRNWSELGPPDDKIDPAISGASVEDHQAESVPNAVQITTLPPEVIEKRQKHLEKLQSESDKRYHNHTRRRRTRPWAGLPADPPGPPRFPSETTIDESKQILGLNPQAYVSVREQFQAICEEEKIRKKTEAGAEQWQHVKNRLIAENPVLHAVYFTNQPVDHTQQNLALDVICSDVTKRMRTMNTRLTIQECKNILKTNPEEARRLRRSFENILRADSFTSKLEAGPEHWKELKEQWRDQSTHLQDLLRDGEADPEYGLKIKAMEMMCRDVMKRLRDEQTRKEPIKKLNAPGPKVPRSSASQDNGVRLAAQALAATPLPSSHARAPVQAPPTPAQHQPPSKSSVPLAGITSYSDMQIDPKLLLAANDSSLSLNPDTDQNNYTISDEPSQQMHHHGPGSISQPQPIYFRLSPNSPIQQEPKVWLASLDGVRSVDNLRSLAHRSHSHFSYQSGVSVVKVEGLVLSSVNGMGTGGAEIRYPIDEDDELLAYLQHVTDSKATFRVQFV